MFYLERCLSFKRFCYLCEKNSNCFCKMIDLVTIFTEIQTTQGKIDALKEKSIHIPSWEALVKDYDPQKHKIIEDTESRQRKVRSDGSVEEPARIAIGLEDMLCKRVNEFTFAIPVKRVYSNLEDNETRKEIAKAMEKIYKSARINSENIKRGLAYYACCEIFSVWYVVEKPNNLYGFPSKYKLKCRTFSPMDGTTLYPLFDETGDLVAMSFEYTRKVEGNDVLFFETYTEEKHYKWKNESDQGWVDVTPEGGDIIRILKIPGIYNWRRKPIYDGLEALRSDLEYTLSRNSDVIAYNSAPVMKISGGIQGEEKKGDSRRIFRVENGGDVAYVSWQQANDAIKYHVEMLLKLYFMQAQMPDISFDNMKSLGNIGYDARMTLLMDAHLKIGDESGNWLEFLDREVNVIKAFLKLMNTKWANEIDNVEVENIITPFVQNDRKGLIDTLVAGNGGKAVMSQLDSIREFGESDDPDATLKQIQEEENVSLTSSMESVFANGSAE